MDRFLARAAAAPWFAALSARLRPYALPLAASAVLGSFVVPAIVAATGRQALPLDDAFIHFQYAKQLARGALYAYAPGRGYTTGATSLLWPLALAPFYAIGFRGLALIDVAWAFGAAAHAALAVEAGRIATRLAGRPFAGVAAAGRAAPVDPYGVAAGGMCLAFGAYLWFAWSGMETVPLAWLLLRCVRLASDLCEPARPERLPLARRDPARVRRALVVAGACAALLRPEGALGAFIASAAIAIDWARATPGDGAAARPTRAASAGLVAVPIACVLLLPAMHLVFAGHATSATATVKWLALNPYESRGAFLRATWANVRQLVGSVLDGGDFTNIFLPEGSAYAFALGGPALVVAACRRRAPLTAAALGVVALGALLPCTYTSFLWNRLRYVWPFSAAHFVMLACVASEAGLAARRLRPSLTFVGPALAGVFVGALATHLPWALRDLVQSANAIDEQQVKLGEWAHGNLPDDAVIGVNDTGAIAYLSDRATFDIVGLTTEGEARYWVAGAGSRFEHYEKLPRAALPTHFIVYPSWMACPPLLGPELTEATVVDQSILGGPTMVAFEARWDALGSGASPARPPAGLLVDELDVADLESERAHRYEIGFTSDADDVLMTSRDPARGAPGISDGGRIHRSRDRFRLRFGDGGPMTLVVRAGAEEPTILHVTVDGQLQGAVAVAPGPFSDVTIAVETTGGGEREVVVTAGEAEFGSFHYWLYAPAR